MTNEPSTTNRAVSFSRVLTEMIVNGRQWKRKESARYEYVPSLLDGRSIKYCEREFRDY